jgi:hypothetical protein
VVIARAPGEEFVYHARQLGATLVDGSYRDESVLVRAGVPAASAIDIEGRRLVVRQGTVGDPDVLLPLARVHPDGSADLLPDGGDDLLCLATSEAVRRPEGISEDRGGWRRWLREEMTYLRGIIGAADRRLWYLVAIIVFLASLTSAWWTPFTSRRRSSRPSASAISTCATPPHL